jgi:predicted permease
MIRALRTLRNEPGFALTAVFTLALGIACSSAMFSVFYAVLLAPVPFADAQRVVAIHTRSTTTGRSTPRLSGGDWSDLAASSGIFESVTRYHGGVVGVQLRNRAEWAGSYWVSPNFFQVFDAVPVRGRSFTDADRERAVVVNDRFARRVFGDTVSAVGQVIQIDTRAYEVVGVMPGDFAVPEKAEIWVADPPQPQNHSRTAYNYSAVGRLAPGLTAEAAQVRLAALGAQLASQYPENRNKTFDAIPLRDTLARNEQSTLFLLMAAVLLVLLISCTNVAHLLLARAAGRTREYAIRTALGAGGVRIALQVLAESLTIGLGGGITGIALAYAGVRATVWLAPATLPRIEGAEVNWKVLLFAIGISMAASLLFGFVPAFEAMRKDVQEGLKAASGRGVVGGGKARLRHVLVCCEIALSFTLAVAAGLLARSMVELNATPLGFRPEGIVVANAHSPANTMEKMRAATRFFDQALLELAQIPGVISTGAAMGLPAGRYGSNGKYAVEGQDFKRDRDSLQEAGFRLASQGYFTTLGIPLVAGRAFTERDQFDAPFVAVISTSLARRSFAGQDPLGRQIMCGFDSNRWMTIVGVVGDVRSGGRGEAPGPELYMPFQQHPKMANELQLVVRTAGSAQAMAGAVARKVRELNPEIAIQTTLLETMVSDSVAMPRFRAFLVTTFAGVALLLAMAGVYGVMAYLVSQRTGELGLRMALGCAPAGVVRLVLTRALGMAAAGVAVGIALSLAGARLMTTLLFGVRPGDALGYGAAVLAILGVTLAAALAPAWRAARIDPAVALRGE